MRYLKVVMPVRIIKIIRNLKNRHLIKERKNLIYT